MDATIIVWIAALLVMMFFSGMEMAFYSANRLNIELKRKQETAKGQRLGKFIDTPAVFLGVTIVGYIMALTIFVLLTGVVARPLWQSLAASSRGVQVFLEILGNVLVVLLFAEFIPRALFRGRSTILLSRLSSVMNIFYEFFSPVVLGLFKMSDWILKYVLNVRLDKNKSPLGKNELRLIFSDRTNNHTYTDNSTHQLLENAQELPNIKIKQSMVPRKEVVGADVKTPIDQLLKKFIETKRTRIIIYEDSIDNILGYVHQLDFFKKPTDIKSMLIDIIAVPQSMNAVDLIYKLSSEAKSIAWVVDEFGGTAGIITMEDVLEELFGEIWDEYDTEKFIEKQIAEGEYIFSGRLELDYLEHKYDLSFEGHETETLSGYIINRYETIPAQKERIIIDDYEFDVIDVTHTRIEMVKLKKLK